MDYQPFEVSGAERNGPWVIACDHATNTVPPFVNGGSLDLPAGDMGRHIAYDVGIKGVSLALGALLNAPVICSNFSRLVIDPNRGEDDPTLLMKLYDGTIIPANRHADEAEKTRRLEACYRPYHAALKALMDERTAPVLLTLHSFTPQLAGRPKRPWHVGVLHASDTRLSDPLLDLLRQNEALCVGRNQPYGGHLPGDTIDKHAITQGRHNTLVEIRNDLIQTETQQSEWAKRLAPVLQDALRITLQKEA
ncbi:N-formylglutamate amidohydrolase [Lentibacter sp. XHP0401]|uniref:N-formylglutamate amidohydrolase n=1 Tax=Lentibacter sp. XHP0401 TaxID=2984334 RepID=UPI0021E925EB|nr:N-formylglutamate amidohydrolase [Lentibacter sp. XHP0401]MCV2893735.1 N-formylglutamate amidohydrolase [Lentibacter sp. XHP0401]